MKRVRVTVSGEVQGVFFRKGCAEEARKLGVSGFVRNNPDGVVEAAFEGPDADVDAMVHWCRRGTDWADVENVHVEEEQPKGDTGFTIEH
jgi:acylphosphatase